MLTVLRTLPIYEQAVWDEAGNVANAEDAVKWSGTFPPPALDTKIIVTMNRCGPAVVTGYFVEHGWLGVACILTDPPEWHRKQNKGDRSGYVFGAEIALA